MAKITLNDLTSNYGSQALHNANNDTIEDNLNNKVLYRDNPDGEPNSMQQELDMNSNRIINMADGVNNTDAVSVSQLNALIAGTGNVSNVIQARESQLGSQAVARVFTLSGIVYALGVNTLAVYRNGQRLEKSVDYLESSSSTVTLTFDPNVNDRFVFITNALSTSVAGTTDAITHTEDSTTYNLATYLQNRHVVSVQDFGAVADYNGTSGTDNTAAFQAAIDSGKSVFIPDGEYAFASQITNPDVVPIFGPGKLFFTGSGEHAFIFGAADGSSHQYPSSLQSNIYLERATKDWSDQFGGVCLFNTEGHQLTIHARKFYYPIYMQGYDAGCTFNNYTIKLAGDGVSQIYMDAAGTGGWVNQNCIYGGRFFTVSATSTTEDITGVEFHVDSSSTINGNTFFNPSFELFNAGAGTTQAFKGSGVNPEVAIKNKLVGGRLENTAYLLGGKGVFTNEFAPASTQFAATTASQLLNPDSADDALVLMNNKFDVIAGDLGLDEAKSVAKLARGNFVSQQPGGTELGCKPARGVIFEAGSSDQFVFHDAKISLKHDSFVNGAADTILGWLVDLRGVQEDYTKRLTLKATTNADGGRFAAVCFDASFNLLETSSDCSLTFNASNGLFRTGGDITAASSEVFIQFGDNVAYAVVGVVQGSANADLKSLELLSIGRADINICYDSQAVSGIGVKTVNSISVAPIIDTDLPIATQTPLTPVSGNSYQSGQRVINAIPASAAPGDWLWDGSTSWLPSVNLP